MTTPRNPLEFIALLFADSRERFRPVEEIRDRFKDYNARFFKLQNLGFGDHSAVPLAAATGRLLRTLDMKEYDALLQAHLQKLAQKQVSMFLASTFTTSARVERVTENTHADFPEAAETMAGVFEFMAGRVGEEIERLRPEEAARLKPPETPLLVRMFSRGVVKETVSEDEPAPEPIEQRSPVLRALLDYQGKLETLAQVARTSPDTFPFDFAKIEEVLNVLDGTK